MTILLCARAIVRTHGMKKNLTQTPRKKAKIVVFVSLLFLPIQILSVSRLRISIINNLAVGNFNKKLSMIDTNNNPLRKIRTEVEGRLPIRRPSAVDATLLDNKK